MLPVEKLVIGDIVEL